MSRYVAAPAEQDARRRQGPLQTATRSMVCRDILQINNCSAWFRPDPSGRTCIGAGSARYQRGWLSTQIMESTNLLAYLPMLMFLMLALFFFLLWILQLSSSWLWSAGFVQSACGFGLSTFPVEPHLDQLVSGLLFVGAAYCYGSAVIIHFGADLRLRLRRGLVLAFLIPHVYFIYVTPNLRIVLFFIEATFAGLTAIAVFTVIGRARNLADRFLICSCLLVMIDCLVRGVVFTFLYPTSERMSDFVQSAYNLSVHATTVTICLLFPFAAISALTLQAVERQRQAALRDPLTGLLNRRGFEAALDEMLAAGVRSGAVVVLDIDNFKRINDGYGHPAGDRVIVELARTLDRSAIGGARLARFGGEEFVVLLSHVDEATAECWAESMRSGLGTVGPAAGLPHPITASFGVSRVPDFRTGMAAALKAADAALYVAKQGGRDRVMRASALNAAAGFSQPLSATL